MLAIREETSAGRRECRVAVGWLGGSGGGLLTFGHTCIKMAPICLHRAAALRHKSAADMCSKRCDKRRADDKVRRAC